MYGNRVVTTSSYDIVPQLAALLFGPRVGSLVNWDDELRRFLEQVEQLGFGGFHSVHPIRSLLHNHSISQDEKRE